MNVTDSDTPVYTVHGAEADADAGPPPWIGPVGVIAFVVLGCLAFLYARPHDRLLKLLLAAIVSMPIHSAGFVLAGLAAKLRIVRVAFYYGGVILRTRVGETWFCVGWLPLGSYVKFARHGELGTQDPAEPGTWNAISPIRRAAIALGGSTLLLAFGCLMIGPSAALAEAVEVPLQSLAALSGEYTSLLNGFFRFVDRADARLVIGVFAAKVAAVNLLPIPIFNGGQALIELMQGLLGRPLPNRVLSMLQVTGLFAVIAFFIYSLYAVPAAWRTAVG